jgi:transcriptional regulator with XRE-family HTH domain
MPRTKPGEEQVRRDIASKLREVMRAQGWTQKEVAETLGITRQALSLYLNGKTMPSARVLLKACAAFGLVIHSDGMTFSSSKPRMRRTAPAQLSLWEALEHLNDDDLQVKIERKGPGRLGIQIDINFSAG